MKVKICNLGVIKEAEIELRPLTVFIGPNNTGKSWLAYTLAAVLGSYGWERYLSAYIADDGPEAYPPLEEAIKQVIAEGNARIDLVQFARDYGVTCINRVAALAHTWLPQFLGTQYAHLEHVQMQLELDRVWKRFLQQIMGMKVEGSLGVGEQRGEGFLRCLKERDDPAVFFYTVAGLNPLDKIPAQVVRDFLVSSTLPILREALFTGIRIFPTERPTYVSLPVYRSHPDGDGVGRLEQGTPLSEPVNSLLWLMLEARNSDLLVRRETAKNMPAIKQYIDLSELLQREILAGVLDFSEPDLTGWRRLIFALDRGNVLDMPVVSSMVKELAPLVIYLRYLAEPNELLVIDEPEMNLHPEAQARMMEFLVMLVNAGLPVLVTTHSPYFVDHLVNLMKAAEHADQEAIREKFLLGRSEAFIPKEQVSVYLFEK
ncbi:MAG: AAA family ATPase, partial [Chloroflexota bacterium]